MGRAHKVYIWMPKGGSVGHASLEMSSGEYVSWWPRGGKKEKSKCGIGKKSSTTNSSLEEDIREMGRHPNHTFTIPEENLDEEEMENKWDSWFTNGHYSLLGNNCCQVVYKILRAGGAPVSATTLWRPETLRRYMATYLGGSWRITTFLNLPFTDMFV